MPAASRRPIAWGIALAAIGVLAWLLLRERGGSIDADAERAAGPASLEPPPLLGTPDLAASGGMSRATSSAAVSSTAATAPAPQTAPATDEKAVETSTVIECVDAVTGEPIALGEPATGDVVREYPARKVGFVSVPWPEQRSLHLLGDPRRLQPTWIPGFRVFRVPEPYFDAADGRPQSPSRGATGFRATVPLHRAVNVDLRFLDEAGRPTDDVQVDRWSSAVAGGPKRSASPVIDGRVRLERLPFVPGDEISVLLVRPSSREEASAPDGSSGGYSLAQQRFAATMPASYQPALSFEVTLRWTGPKHVWRRGVAKTSKRSEEGRRAALGSVRTRVTDPAGAPMPDVVVSVGSRSAATDAYGLALLTDVPIGRSTLYASTAATRIAFREVDVVEGVETSVELQAMVECTVDVTVVDEAERPVPFALLEFDTEGRLPWVDVGEDGTQRLDSFTDRLGHRVCRGVPPGSVPLRASWNGKAGEAKLELRGGDRRVVRIVVK